MSKCIKCECELKRDEHGTVYQGGTFFISFGYGSDYDQLPCGIPEEVELSKAEKLATCAEVRGFICDRCFEKHVDLLEGYKVTTEKPVWERIV